MSTLAVRFGLAFKFLPSSMKRIYPRGVPAVAQWVKNLTAAVRVTAEARVRHLVWCSELKDLALLQLPLRFNPWPEPLYASSVAIKKKEYVPGTTGPRRVKNYLEQICTRTTAWSFTAPAEPLTHK